MHKQKGFTLIELLIAIAVIGILSTIVGVTYSNSQEKVKLARARAHLEAMAEATSNYRTMNPSKEYPSTDAAFVNVLKDAGVYEKTRKGSEESYALCSSPEGYVLVAWGPIVTSWKRGDSLYTYAHDNGQYIETLTNSSLESNLQLEKICNMVYPVKYNGKNPIYMLWSYDLP